MDNNNCTIGAAAYNRTVFATVLKADRMVLKRLEVRTVALKYSWRYRLDLQRPLQLFHQMPESCAGCFHWRGQRHIHTGRLERVDWEAGAA